ncbi:hypothetical protein [Bradyrhizobium sp. S69]|uniref:hypothetical protein n=1 Tax=Bradyrhizobium sp. S69 TaxID=1641856 RepID=UPI00131ACF93|nr:hypothetical protein [Bradyrhizobium sp. S69]
MRRSRNYTYVGKRNQVEQNNPSLPERRTTLGHMQLTPPCIYLFPRSVPTVRNNPAPEPHTLEQIGFLAAIHKCFGGYDDEIHKARFLVANNDVVRTTSFERNSVVQHTSRATPIRRK